MTADCLPVLFCDRAGTRVAAAHAGWRGLADGVLEATAAAIGGDLMAWLGPAIGPRAFEVGPPVRQAFLERLGDCAAAFHQTDDSHWLADLYQLARLSLARVGITEVYGGEYCTLSDPTRFFSYRRDGQTGRMATLIWRE
jgi:YfiH family protein